MANILAHKPLVREIRGLPASATKSQIEIDVREIADVCLESFLPTGKNDTALLSSTPKHWRSRKSLSTSRCSVDLVPGPEDRSTMLPRPTFLADVICMLWLHSVPADHDLQDPAWGR